MSVRCDLSVDPTCLYSSLSREDRYTIHLQPGAAVLAAHGFSPKRDLLQQLLDLNLEVAKRIDQHDPVTAPGIPPDFPNHKSLITDDCIRPAKL
jgi:hypothetical protein